MIALSGVACPSGRSSVCGTSSARAPSHRANRFGSCASTMSLMPPAARCASCGRGGPRAPRDTHYRRCRARSPVRSGGSGGADRWGSRTALKVRLAVVSPPHSGRLDRLPGGDGWLNALQSRLRKPRGVERGRSTPGIRARAGPHAAPSPPVGPWSELGGTVFSDRRHVDPANGVGGDESRHRCAVPRISRAREAGPAPRRAPRHRDTGGRCHEGIHQDVRIPALLRIPGCASTLGGRWRRERPPDRPGDSRSTEAEKPPACAPAATTYQPTRHPPANSP